jgi:hypothetical protein
VALCGRLGTIGASASAAGGALNLLRQDYRVAPIGQTAAGVFPSHIVIGPADLNDPHVIDLLKRSYRGRQDRRHRPARPNTRPTASTGEVRFSNPLALTLTK